MEGRFLLVVTIYVATSIAQSLMVTHHQSLSVPLALSSLEPLMVHTGRHTAWYGSTEHIPILESPALYDTIHGTHDPSPQAAIEGRR